MDDAHLYLNNYGSSHLQQEDDRLSLNLVFLLPFIASAISVAALPGFNWLVWGLGIICAAVFVMESVQARVAVPREVILFLLFFVWSTLGLLNAASTMLFWSKYLQLAQFCVLLAVVAHFAANLRTLRWILASVMAGVLITGASAYLTGDYKRTDVADRAAGFALNANAFSLILVYGTAILLYFIKTARSIFLKAVLVTMLSASAVLVIASGSRTGFISFVFFVLVWFILTYGTEIRQQPVAFLAGAVLIGILALVATNGFEGSLLERRFATITEGGLDTYKEGSSRVRKQMYFTALTILIDHPIIGVGAGNFIVHSGHGLYGHSNYIEVFTSTGIPGGFIYYSVFGVLWLKLRRLRRWFSDNEETMAVVRLSQVLVLTHLLSGLAAVTWTAKIDWIVFAALIGWTSHLERFARSATEPQSEFYGAYPSQSYTYAPSA